MKDKQIRALPHPSLKGIEYVLFPYDPRVQIWDNCFLVALLYYSFAIPYMIGISGGYTMQNSVVWLVINILLNFLFLGETFYLTTQLSFLACIMLVSCVEIPDFTINARSFYS